MSSSAGKRAGPSSSIGAALIEYIVLMGGILLVLLIGFPSVGTGVACTMCATKYGLSVAMVDDGGFCPVAYAAVGPPPTPSATPTLVPSEPDPATNPEEFLVLCRDGFIDLTTCEEP